MLRILVIVTILGLSTCLQSGSPGPAKILRSFNEQSNPSSYKFFFDQSDGISRHEEGAIGINPNQLRSETVSRDDPSALHVNGAVYWTDKDGANYEMTYKSGTYGYRTIIKRIS